MATPRRKRRESFGAIRKLPSGRYQASYVGPDGERHNAPRTFDALTDARGWLAIQQARILDGTWSAHDTARAEAAGDEELPDVGSNPLIRLAADTTPKNPDPPRVTVPSSQP